MYLYTCISLSISLSFFLSSHAGWWFVNVDDFHEGWVPATYLEPLYGSSDETAAQTFAPGEGIHTCAPLYISTCL